LDEQTLRFNNREDKDSARFVKVLKGVDGRRLRYDRLISANPLRKVTAAKRVRKPRHPYQEILT
jgi:hypothetical protein